MLGCAAAKHGAHARHQFARRKRLDDVVVGAGIEARHAICLAPLGGQHDDRQLARSLLGAQLAQEVDTAAIRQHPVEDDEVGQLRPDRLLGSAHGIGPNHGIAVGRAREGDQFLDRRLVLHHEDGSAHSTISLIMRTGY
jgi:hypothetical protein